MLQDTALLLHTIYNYIRDFHGSIAQAYQFPHACQKPLVLEDIPPYLLCRLTADTYLFHIDEPIRSILILLDGTCCVEKYSHLGHLYTDTTRSAIQIFGLIEAVTNQPRHSVSLRCATNCTFAKIPLAEYLQTIRSNPELMMMSMQYLCVFFTEHVQNADSLMLDTPYRKILVKLYQCCSGQQFPVTIPYKKEELAADLNMNLRSMYRHMNKLYTTGLCSSQKGKIIISAEQYRQIEEELSDFHSSP